MAMIQPLDALESNPIYKAPFQATLEQKIYSSLSKRTKNENISLYYGLQKKFRWESIQKNREETYISNGEVLWKYTVLDKTKHAQRIPLQSQLWSFLSVVFDPSQIKKNYTVKNANFPNTSFCPIFKGMCQDQSCLELKSSVKIAVENIIISITDDKKTPQINSIFFYYPNKNCTLIHIKKIEKWNVNNIIFQFKPSADTLVDTDT